MAGLIQWVEYSLWWVGCWFLVASAFDLKIRIYIFMLGSRSLDTESMEAKSNSEVVLGVFEGIPSVGEQNLGMRQVNAVVYRK